MDFGFTDTGFVAFDGSVANFLLYDMRLDLYELHSDGTYEHISREHIKKLPTKNDGKVYGARRAQLSTYDVNLLTMDSQKTLLNYNGVNLHF